MSDAPPPVANLVTLGETMGLLSADGIGDVDYVRGFRLGIGGSEGNVAIGVARLGGAACWIGRVGSDALGSLITRRMRGEGIDTVAIRDPGFTGIMIRYERAGGVIHVDYHRRGSAGSHLTPQDVPPSRVAAATILHVTGITPALSASARETVRYAVDLARGAGVLVSLDVNYRRKLWDPAEASVELRAIARQADILFAGPQEAELVLDVPAGSGPADLARGLADLGPREVVVKCGSDGCVGFIDGELSVQPAPTVRVVDPVGAGDACVAGYLAERLAGSAAPERLSAAVRMGAYAVTVPGDCELLPTRAELDMARTVTDVQR